MRFGIGFAALPRLMWVGCLIAAGFSLWLIGHAWAVHDNFDYEPPQGMDVSIAGLTRAFVVDRVSADHIYRGRWVTISGEITDVDKGGAEGVTVILRDTKNTAARAHALFFRRPNDLVSDIASGQIVTVTCLLSALGQELTLTNCTVRSLYDVPPQ